MIKEKNVRVGVATWIFNPEGLVLMGKRLSKHGTNTWGAPGGHLEFGETPAHAASRELMEETGIFIPETSFRYIGITNDIFPDKHYITIHLRADSITNEPTVCEPDKCEQWQWFATNNMPKNLFLPVQNLMKQKNAFMA